MRLELASAHSANLVGIHDAAVFQHLQVLHHGRERNTQRPCEAAHRRRPMAQVFDQPTPGWVAKSMKDLINLRLVKHTLKYKEARAIVKCPLNYLLIGRDL